MVPTFEHAGNVLALDADRSAGFAAEALGGVAALGHLAPQELHGDALFQLLVPCSNDHAHAALAQDGLDAVLASEDLALLYRSSGHNRDEA